MSTEYQGNTNDLWRGVAFIVAGLLGFLFAFIKDSEFFGYILIMGIFLLARGAYLLYRYYQDSRGKKMKEFNSNL